LNGDDDLFSLEGDEIKLDILTEIPQDSSVVLTDEYSETLGVRYQVSTFKFTLLIFTIIVLVLLIFTIVMLFRCITRGRQQVNRDLKNQRGQAAAGGTHSKLNDTDVQLGQNQSLGIISQTRHHKFSKKKSISKLSQMKKQIDDVNERSRNDNELDNSIELKAKRSTKLSNNVSNLFERPVQTDVMDGDDQNVGNRQASISSSMMVLDESHQKSMD